MINFSYQMTQRDHRMLERRSKNLSLPTSIQRELILDKYQATESKLEYIKAQLTVEHCPIQSLVLRQNQMNDRKTAILCEAITNNSSLITLSITRCRLRNSHLSKICQAIQNQKGECIQEVKINQLRINKQGAAAIAKMLEETIHLNSLSLVDAGLDCDTLLEISRGLKQSMSLEFLDLRHNIFDHRGLAGTINALRESMSVKHLYLEGMRISLTDAQLLADFFEQNDCMLEELELNEADINMESLDVIMEALYKADHLRRLSLSKNCLDESICQHLSDLPNRLHNFQSLCLSHCEIGLEALDSLCKGFYGQTTIKCLDLSWNNISSEGMEIILNMLKENKSLEKLLIQHNYLGPEGARQMVQALKIHPQMRYLDISANEIGSKGFMYFEELFFSNCNLETLHVRKNNIKGEKIMSFPAKLHDNSNLHLLDLQDNRIDTDCAKQLITLLHDNYFIEDLILKGNNYADKMIIETINEECRKNLLIKEFILPKLTTKGGMYLKDKIVSSVTDVHFKNYNVERLELQDMTFFRSDFIAKFMDMNKKEFLVLSLTRVKFGNNMKDLAEFLNTAETSIETLILNDCDVGDTSVSKIISVCQNLKSLKELRLIKMHLASHTREIQKNLQDHKKLKILDISYNGIQQMGEISNLLIRNNSIETLNICGNKVSTAESLRQLLMGMVSNLSVIQLNHSIDQYMVQGNRGVGPYLLDKNEIIMLDQQIKMNIYIKNIIIPSQTKKGLLNSQTLDLSYSLIADQVEAVVKYFRLKKKSTLILQGCDINDQVALDLVGHLLNMQTFEIDTLDLSLNRLTDLGCKHLGDMLQTDKKLKKLDLGKNINITKEGFKTIIKGIKQNTHIQELDFSVCSIELENASEWGPVLDDITQNCSLTSLNLDGTSVSQKFINKVEDELSQNKLINDIIKPSIIQKEEDLKKQKANYEKKQQKRKSTLNFDPRLANISGTGTLNLGVYNRNSKRKQSFLGLNIQKDFKAGGSEIKIDIESEKSVSGESQTLHDDSRSQLDVLEQKEGMNIQKLTLRGKNLTSLDFLSKFMRENPNIGDIDIGDNPLTDIEMQKFSKNMQSNKQIRSIALDGIKNLKSGTKTIIKRELDYNKQIYDKIGNRSNRNKQSINDTDKGNLNTLNLQNQEIQNIGFLQKFLQGYQNLQILDLTDNRLGNRGAIEITHLIQETTTIEVLNLQNNRIGPSGLQHICSALTQNESIKYLDIRDNMIQDESLKILLAMLFKNSVLQNIKYSVTNEENIKRLQQFKDISHLNVEEIEEKLEKFQDHQELSWKQKLCLPLWCWKSFIQDKHEAFRFKYDTKALNMIEDELMDGMTFLLYLNSLIYYIIMFVAPISFVEECGGGLNIISHYIYGIYSVVTIIVEVALVLRIEKKIQNKNILKLNKWHIVELLMGQLARFDTYLDVCFFSLLYQCSEWNLALPIGILIILYILYPLYNLVTLLWVKTSLKHTLPKIERNCNLCFIRESMMLATVLDSFCIDNNAEICKKPIAFGRIMGIWTLLTQDGPQYIIHLYFLFFVYNKVSHTDSTVILSLVISSFAIQVSIFNCIMCTQNEFDPILLQIELKKRQDKILIREQNLKKKKQALLRKMTGQTDQQIKTNLMTTSFRDRFFTSKNKADSSKNFDLKAPESPPLKGNRLKKMTQTLELADFSSRHAELKLGQEPEKVIKLENMSQIIEVDEENPKSGIVKKESLKDTPPKKQSTIQLNLDTMSPAKVVERTRKKQKSVGARGILEMVSAQQGSLNISDLNSSDK